MAFCTYHPQVPTNDGCANCRRPFCASCLTDLMGARYCGHCRDAVLAQMQHQPPAPNASRPPTAVDHIVPTKNPMALTGYYLGVGSLIPCLALLLGPAAIFCGLKGLRAQKENPHLSGKAHALVAIILGGVTTLLNLGFLLIVGLGIAALAGR